MPIYSYKAIDSDRKKSHGMINAFNRSSAIERLKERSLKILALDDKTDSFEIRLLTIIRPVAIKDLVVFSRQFSVMISANLVLVQALKIAAEQTNNVALRLIISEVAYEVDGGSALSTAMAKRPKIFSPFYTNVIRSGETSGRLDEVLLYLADEMEKDYDMASKIKGAMIYPAFVLSSLVIVGIIMMVWIVPKLTSILQETGAQLPLTTRIVIGTSDFLIAYWWVLLIVAISTFFGIRFFLQTQYGRRTLDSIKLRLPVFGELFQLIYIVRFTRSLNTLLAGGVTIAKSLDIVADVVGNSIYKEIIIRSKRDVEEGGSISKAFMASNQIPKMVPQMIVVGEKTGKLDVVLKKVTDFYSREISNTLNNLVSLLEPLIMVVMGVGVGVMMAAILLPMYNLASQF